MRNYKPLDWKDWICLAFGSAAAAMLALTDRDLDRDLVALGVAMAGDTAATVAVLRNIAINPRREHAGCWSLATFSAAVYLGTVTWSWDRWAQALYPVYIVVTMAAITAPLLWHRFRVRRRRRVRAAAMAKLPRLSPTG